MLEFLLEPLIDMQYFGCPDQCIVPDSQQHVAINFLVTPIVWIIIAVGAGLGALKRLGKLKLRKRKHREKIIVPDYASRIVEKSKEPHSMEQIEKAIRKKQKKEFLRSDLKTDLNPEQAFEQFVNAQDPEHPQSDVLRTVRATTKDDLTPPEQTVLENIKDVNLKVEKLMKEEKLTEDEAVDRIISESKQEVTTPDVAEDILNDIPFDEDTDIFKQDIPPKKYPKQLKQIEKKFKKKAKPKVRFELNNLGKQRRDQYASQIETKLTRWALPMPKYNGKNKDYQLDQDQISLAIKRLSLFLSMGEFIADRKRKKKRYWSKIKIG